MVLKNDVPTLYFYWGTQNVLLMWLVLALPDSVLGKNIEKLAEKEQNKSNSIGNNNNNGNGNSAACKFLGWISAGRVAWTIGICLIF